MKYGPRSKLRRACSRFLRFSYLLDFVALDALSNIYIESVKDTIRKLKTLNEVNVDNELKSLKVDYNAPKKSNTAPKELPFFLVNGHFEETEIPKDYYIYEKIETFEPPPLGSSTIEDFDPTVHLEIQEKRDIDEEV